VAEQLKIFSGTDPRLVPADALTSAILLVEEIDPDVPAVAMELVPDDPARVAVDFGLIVLEDPVRAVVAFCPIDLVTATDLDGQGAAVTVPADLATATDQVVPAMVIDPGGQTGPADLIGRVKAAVASNGDQEIGPIGPAAVTGPIIVPTVSTIGTSGTIGGRTTLST
jgi:hypothetical protein